MLRESGEFSLPTFKNNTYDPKKYYPREAVNIHKQILINITQDNIWIITTKNR